MLSENTSVWLYTYRWSELLQQRGQRFCAALLYWFHYVGAKLFWLSGVKEPGGLFTNVL